MIEVSKVRCCQHLAQQFSRLLQRKQQHPPMPLCAVLVLTSTLGVAVHRHVKTDNVVTIVSPQTYPCRRTGDGCCTSEGFFGPAAAATGLCYQAELQLPRGSRVLVGGSVEPPQPHREERGHMKSSTGRCGVPVSCIDRLDTPCPSKSLWSQPAGPPGPSGRPDASSPTGSMCDVMLAVCLL